MEKRLKSQDVVETQSVRGQGMGPSTPIGPLATAGAVHRTSQGACVVTFPRPSCLYRLGDSGGMRFRSSLGGQARAKHSTPVFQHQACAGNSEGCPMCVGALHPVKHCLFNGSAWIGPASGKAGASSACRNDFFKPHAMPSHPWARLPAYLAPGARRHTGSEEECHVRVR